jgi:hypothetical protein
MSATFPGRILQYAQDIREELIEMCFRPIWWRETICAAMSHGANAFLQVGPGEQLAALNERMFPGSVTISVHDQASAETVGRRMESRIGLGPAWADWLIQRVEFRAGTSMEGAVKDAIRSEMTYRPLTSHIAEAFGDDPAILQGDRWWRNQVLREARLFYNSRPTFSVDAVTDFPQSVSLDPDALKRMEKARRMFRQEQPHLQSQMASYWQSVLSRYAGDIIRYNPLHFPPRISVNILTVSARFEHLKRRLAEISQADSALNLEVALVIADPDQYPQDKLDTIKRLCGQLPFSVTMVTSRKNTIPINRNLATAVSQGEYRIYLDDDVRLVGPVIERVVEVLDRREEIGMVTLPSYDETGLIRPLKSYQRVWVGPDLLYSRDLGGMMMAVRSDFALVIPSPEFWSNVGEDNVWAQSLHLLGFFCAFHVPADSYLYHEKVSYSVTKSPTTVVQVLVSDGLQFVVKGKEIEDSGRLPVMIAGYHRFVTERLKTRIPIKDVQEFIAEFWEASRLAIEDRPLQPQQILSCFSEHLVYQEIQKSVYEALNYLTHNKDEIKRYVQDFYLPWNLSGINTISGPFVAKDAEELERPWQPSESPSDAAPGFL